MSNELKVDLAGVGKLVAWLREEADLAHYRAEEDMLTEAADTIEILATQLAEARAENERLRETVDAVWKEATTMRNASKLVGPHPTEPSKHRVWVRSMYHAGKKLHELMKPIRALKENPNAG